MLLIQNINEVMIEVIFMTSDGRVIYFELSHSGRFILNFHIVEDLL